MTVADTSNVEPQHRAAVAERLLDDLVAPQRRDLRRPRVGGPPPRRRSRPSGRDQRDRAQPRLEADDAREVGRRVERDQVRRAARGGARSRCAAPSSCGRARGTRRATSRSTSIRDAASLGADVRRRLADLIDEVRRHRERRQHDQSTSATAELRAGRRRWRLRLAALIGLGRPVERLRADAQHAVGLGDLGVDEHRDERAEERAAAIEAAAGALADSQRRTSASVSFETGLSST